MKDIIIGNTIRVTWVSSGVTPTTIYTGVYDGDETLVHSESMVSSGNGHYYLDYTVPTSLGYYATEVNASINSKVYKKRLKFQTVTGQVD